MHMHIWTHTQISLTNFKLCILYWESWGYVLVKDEHVKHELSQIIPSQKRYQTFIIASLPAVGSSHRCSCDPTTKNVFPQKLVSCGGLDVCSRCLAPFEISVLEDRRTAPAVSLPRNDECRTSPFLLRPPLSPLKDNWFLLVLRAPLQPSSTIWNRL